MLFINELINKKYNTKKGYLYFIDLIRETLGLTFMKAVEKTGDALMSGLKEVAESAKELVKEVVESAPVVSTGEAIKEGTKVIKEKMNEVVETINNKK